MSESHDPIGELLREHCLALTDYVCPLYVVERKNGVLLGSGVPVRVGRTGVIVTATHVLRAALAYPNRIWTVGVERPFKLRSDWYGFEYKKGGTVDVDVSLIPLSEQEWEQVSRRYSVTSLMNIGDPPSDVDFLVVVGYPYSRNKPTPMTRHAVSLSCTYVASNVHRPTPTDRQSGKEEQVHFGVFAKPTTGRQRHGFPNPKGMSGGGVWNLRVRDTLMGRGTAQLVGIGIEYDTSAKRFTCTRVSVIAPMIQELLRQAGDGAI